MVVTGVVVKMNKGELVKRGDRVRVKEDIFYREEGESGLYLKKDTGCWIYLNEGTTMTVIEDGEIQDVELDGGYHTTSLRAEWVERCLDG